MIMPDISEYIDSIVTPDWHQFMAHLDVYLKGI